MYPTDSRLLGQPFTLIILGPTITNNRTHRLPRGRGHISCEWLGWRLKRQLIPKMEQWTACHPEPMVVFQWVCKWFDGVKSANVQLLEEAALKDTWANEPAVDREGGCSARRGTSIPVPAGWKEKIAAQKGRFTQAQEAAARATKACKWEALRQSYTDIV